MPSLFHTILIGSTALSFGLLILQILLAYSRSWGLLIFRPSLLLPLGLSMLLPPRYTQGEARFSKPRSAVFIVFMGILISWILDCFSWLTLSGSLPSNVAGPQTAKGQQFILSWFLSGVLSSFVMLFTASYSGFRSCVQVPAIKATKPRVLASVVFCLLILAVFYGLSFGATSGTAIPIIATAIALPSLVLSVLAILTWSSPLQSVLIWLGTFFTSLTNPSLVGTLLLAILAMSHKITDLSAVSVLPIILRSLGDFFIFLPALTVIWALTGPNPSGSAGGSFRFPSRSPSPSIQMGAIPSRTRRRSSPAVPGGRYERLPLT